MSEIRANTISAANGTGPVTLTKQHAAKAWANLNGSTFGLRDSFNITSENDVGPGLYDLSFISTMSDANYAGATNGHRDGDQAIGLRATNNSDSTYRTLVVNHTNSTDSDTDSAFSVIFGDLA